MKKTFLFIILAVLVLLIVGYLWGRSREDRISPSPSPSFDTKPSAETLQYENEEFGFEFTPPIGWEEFRTCVNKRSEPEEKGHTYIYFYLPTKEDVAFDGTNCTPEKSPRSFKNSVESGYYSMFVIHIWDKSVWDQMSASPECNPITLGCPIDTLVITEDEKYVYTIDGAQDYPDDLKPMVPTAPDGSTGFNPAFLKESFKLL